MLAIAIAALGAGLVHLAVAAGATPWLLAPLAALGAAELLWAIMTLRRGTAVAPRTAIAVAIAPTAVWALALTAGITELPMPPMLVASVLGLAAGVGLVLSRRPSTSNRASGTRRRRSTAATLLPVLGSAVIVSALVTPALAATEAGGQAVPHGQHGLTLIDEGHSGH